MFFRRAYAGFALSCALVATVVAVASPASAHDVVAPKPKTQPGPEWPQGKRDRHDVVVPVVLTVGEDGHVTAAVVESSVSPEFDEAAVTGAKAWTFEPAMRDGKPVAARIRSIVRFVGASDVAPAVQVAPASPDPAPLPAPEATVAAAPRDATSRPPGPRLTTCNRGVAAAARTWRTGCCSAPSTTIARTTGATNPRACPTATCGSTGGSRPMPSSTRQPTRWMRAVTISRSTTEPAIVSVSSIVSQSPPSTR